MSSELYTFRDAIHTPHGDGNPFKLKIAVVLIVAMQFTPLTGAVTCSIIILSLTSLDKIHAPHGDSNNTSSIVALDVIGGCNPHPSRGRQLLICAALSPPRCGYNLRPSWGHTF